MKHPVRRWLIGIAAVLVLGVGVLVLVVRARLPTDAEVAAKIAEGFEQRFGVALKVGGAHWALLPTPVLVLSDIATDQPRPITLKRISLQLQLAPLLQRVIALDEVELESLVLPRASVRAFRGKGPKPKEGANVGRAARALDAGAGSRGTGALARRGLDRPARHRAGLRRRSRLRPRNGARARPASSARACAARAPAAGPRSRPGPLAHPHRRGRRHVERRHPLRDAGRRQAARVGRAGAAPDRHRKPGAGLRPPHLGGRQGVGPTTLTAEADKAQDLGALLRSLHTRTTFTVQPATLTKLDIAKAVTTAGISRGGRTALDELTGTLDTQGTDDGVVMQYTNLKARSGVLTASGKLRCSTARSTARSQSTWSTAWSACR
jgi:hypothetical protein